jgi:hypothetical protein
VRAWESAWATGTELASEKVQVSASESDWVKVWE